MNLSNLPALHFCIRTTGFLFWSAPFKSTFENFISHQTRSLEPFVKFLLISPLIYAMLSTIGQHHVEVIRIRLPWSVFHWQRVCVKSNAFSTVHNQEWAKAWRLGKEELLWKPYFLTLLDDPRLLPYATLPCLSVVESTSPEVPDCSTDRSFPAISLASGGVSAAQTIPSSSDSRKKTLKINLLANNCELGWE